MTPKNLQSLSITTKSGRSTLPSRYVVKVLRLKPVAAATSEAVSFRPVSDSRCFQYWNNVTLTIFRTFVRIYPNILTRKENYDIIISAKTLNEIKFNIAIIPLFLRIDKRAGLSFNVLADQNKTGSFVSSKNSQAAPVLRTPKAALTKRKSEFLMASSYRTKTARIAQKPIIQKVNSRLCMACQLGQHCGGCVCCISHEPTFVSSRAWDFNFDANYRKAAR